ncbi:hypothetical protein [Alkalibaculum bacchi]|uniref:hypothetical protein n=1 Tax=Alkalibaculum bacchi TaxID=645887 RepID=UPI0026EAA08B|nr:hypothetical protein [Alkalibaculum bacchi]
MEMCYDGALVMPSKFVVIDKEEMMYLDGGKVTTSTYRTNSGYRMLYGVAVALGANAAYGGYLSASMVATGIGVPLAVLTGATAAWQGWYAGKVIDAASDAEVLFSRYGKYKIVSTTLAGIPTGIRAERA